MIITVTLNAALDKTLEVPNFTPGRRHRTVDQTTMAGGKGVNVARAIKRLGQPVIATGLAGGSTGNRIVDALNDESILNGFVRIREESRTNTAVLDPTTGLHTEVNERGPAVSAHELELFREKLLYLAKGASICVFAGSLPRGIDPDVYAGLLREVRKLGVTTVLDTEGEPLRLAMRAEPDVVSPERARGRGARRARVQRRRRPRARGRRDHAAGRGRGDHDRSRRVLRARDRGRDARALSRAGRGAGGALARSAPAMRSSPATSRRAMPAARRSTACASASPAAPSRRSTSAPGSSIPSRVERLLAEVEAERLEIGAEIG